ncbi:hypothetical protein HC928_10295 [bacterium]|nr:hypothetical protein [bacterium]
MYNIEKSIILENTMSERERGVFTAPLGEDYLDLLTIDAALAGKSLANQATSILQARLMAKRELIEERVRELARKREISYEQMLDMLKAGLYKKLTPQEYETIVKDRYELT